MQAQMRSQIKQILAGYEYPPDARDDSIELVIEQAGGLGMRSNGTIAPSMPRTCGWGAALSARVERAAPHPSFS